MSSRIVNLSIVEIEGSHSGRFGAAIVLLNDLKVQGNCIYGLEAGVDLLHCFLSDRIVYSGDEHLPLEECFSVQG